MSMNQDGTAGMSIDDHDVEEEVERRRCVGRSAHRKSQPIEKESSNFMPKTPRAKTFFLANDIQYR